MKISIIVVTYNRIDLLKECIYNIKKNRKFIYKAYVVDNNSNDGTKEYLESIDDDLFHSLYLSDNIGGAGGFSYGLKYAFEHSTSDAFLLMDDDTMIQSSTLDEMIKASNKLNGEFGFLASNVRWYKDNKPSYLNIPEVSKDWTIDLDKLIIKISSSSFVSFLVSRIAVESLGLPIKEMFIWADDVEYSTRISSKFPSYLVPNSIVIHKCKENNYGDDIVNCQMNRIFYYQCMFRNRIYIYRKYYSKKILLLHIFQYLLLVLSVIFKSNNYKYKRIKSILKGIINGLFFNPEINFPTKGGN